MSATFASLPADRVEREVALWLKALARLVRVDRISLWEWTGHENGVRAHFIYSRPGMEPPATKAPLGKFSWLAQQYAEGRTVLWRRVPEDIPDAAVAERAEALRVGAKSVLGIPIRLEHRACVIAFTACRHHLSWRPGTVRRLRLIGEILTSAIVRGDAESALRRSEVSNRAVLKLIPGTLFVCSQDGTYLDYARRDSRESIPPPRDLLGRRVGDILPPELARSLHAAFDRASRTSTRVDLEYEVPRGGVPRHFEARVISRDDGALVCMERDVTARKDSERRLQESEALLCTAFEHVSTGLAVVSQDGRWLRVNPEVTRMLGYTDQELRALDFQSVTHPDDLSADLANLRRTLGGDIDHYRMEKRYIHKDGRIVRAELTAALVRDPQAQPLYFIAQIHDLTERERTLAQVQRLRTDLAHVGRTHLLSHLTASLTHQLLQPVSAILGNVEAAEHMLASDPGDLSSIRAIFHDIGVCGAGAAAILEQVASLLRKESRSHERLDFHGVVLQALELARPHLMLHRVQHVLQLHAPRSQVSGDAIQLQQVVLNLVVNAVTAMSTSPAEERLLVIATANRVREVEFTLSDRGTGAAPAHLDRMFEPFFTTKPQGMGMGLYFAAEIVRAHGGRLWAQNNDGPGLTQHCLLPLAASADGSH